MHSDSEQQQIAAAFLRLATKLPQGASVIDLGCGKGAAAVPICTRPAVQGPRNDRAPSWPMVSAGSWRKVSRCSGVIDFESLSRPAPASSVLRGFENTLQHLDDARESQMGDDEAPFGDHAETLHLALFPVEAKHLPAGRGRVSRRVKLLAEQAGQTRLVLAGEIESGTVG